MRMSSSDSTDPMEAFKKAITKGSDAQKDFIRQFSKIQQDAMQNYFAVLQSLTFHNAMFKTTVQRQDFYSRGGKAGTQHRRWRSCAGDCGTDRAATQRSRAKGNLITARCPQGTSRRFS